MGLCVLDWRTVACAGMVLDEICVPQLIITQGEYIGISWNQLLESTTLLLCHCSILQQEDFVELLQSTAFRVDLSNMILDLTVVWLSAGGR